MTHGQCDARPTVTFPAAEHHRTLAGTKLYCLVTEAHGCEQLAQSCCPAMQQPGVEPATSRSQVQCPTTSLPSHPSSKCKQETWLLTLDSVWECTVTSSLRNRQWGGSVYVLQIFFCFFPVRHKIWDNRSRERLNGFSWNFYQTLAGNM